STRRALCCCSGCDFSRPAFASESLRSQRGLCKRSDPDCRRPTACRQSENYRGATHRTACFVPESGSPLESQLLLDNSGSHRRTAVPTGCYLRVCRQLVCRNASVVHRRQDRESRLHRAVAWPSPDCKNRFGPTSKPTTLQE